MPYTMHASSTHVDNTAMSMIGPEAELPRACTSYAIKHSSTGRERFVVFYFRQRRFSSCTS